MYDHTDQASLTTRESLDLRNLFSKDAEFEIEIGFGKGRFLIERVKACPRAHLLGIEVRAKWAQLVRERCERERLDNARVIAGDCMLIVPRIGPSAAVRRVFIHFPDPWWKKRHAKRRVVRDAMLDQIARLLVPQGELFLQTDVEERALEYLQLVRAHGAFTLTTDSGLIGENPYFARSNREVRAAEDGLPVYRILARRNCSPV